MGEWLRLVWVAEQARAAKRPVTADLATLLEAQARRVVSECQRVGESIPAQVQVFLDHCRRGEPATAVKAMQPAG